MYAWEKPPVERLIHHLGNAFVAGAIALAFWWGAAWLADSDWSFGLSLNIIRWVTVALFLLGGLFFAAWSGIAVWHMGMSPAEARRRYSWMLNEKDGPGHQDQGRPSPRGER